ncbi:heme peroxidase family protein [Roseovarius sp. Pro17]|uniref:peroxidase family protein n=1 Tax=Roseovarius sp. Pro17 TaxID=3108175 RepID=UPI002D7857A0|nr:heme peroxidase family protein [Roseovarius sp. Pro17]
MLYKLGHGQIIEATPKSRGRRDVRGRDYISLNEVASISKSREFRRVPTYPVPDPDPSPEPGLQPRQAFRYYCKDADPVVEIDDAGAKIKALADAMAEADLDQKDEAGESTMPPVFTYFGQFIDHDITANTDREEAPGTEAGNFNIDRPDIAPQSRDVAETVKLNLRKGRLELDSVYGDGPGQSPSAEKLEAALRDPADAVKMRLGTVTPVPGFERPPLPVDNGADLPRVGAAIDSGHLTMAEVNELFNADGSKSDEEVRRLALIGDGRNDENLLVAQFHLSILRLHNAIADKLRSDGMIGDDAIFSAARSQVTHIYQWLVVNVFLKTVCDSAVVDQVLAEKAPLYSAFYDIHKDDVPEGVRPMPIEFSVAAYRYGHSMVRADYDYNRNFGRAADDTGDGRASFRQMFQFTGGGGMLGAPTLPDNWIAEWDRLIGTSPMSNRVARKIDTRLALALNSLENNDPNIMMSRLAERNLRRGYVFNLPTAQAMIRCLYDKDIQIPELSAAEIAQGSPAMQAAVTGGCFDTGTPLWFYLLKEAEVMADGAHLGALGSRIVAETLIGLLVTDERSYLNQGAFGSWTPADVAQPNGAPIDSLAAMMRAGGVHA